MEKGFHNIKIASNLRILVDKIELSFIFRIINGAFNIIIFFLMRNA